MHWLVTWVVITAILLTPLALFLALVALIVQRRETDWWSAHRLAAVVATCVVAYLVAFGLVSFTPVGQLWPAANVGGLYSLADACGLARGARLWLAHLDEPQFGVCALCDDANPPGTGGYRPEYRRRYCH